ncbi:MAG: hypothetical protein GXY59_03185 [Bacteroidales bacterium]|nr:hypothetical protein [Bacteroidales bacterium]
MEPQFLDIPPHDPDLESAVVGAFLAESEAVIQHSVKSEWFYQLENQQIISAVLELSKAGIPPDLISVTQQLKKGGQLDQVGGVTYLTSCFRKIASVANIEHHLRILHDLYQRREMAQKGLQQYRSAFDLSKDLYNLLNEAQNNTLSLMEFETANVVPIAESIEKVISQARRNREGGNLTGIGTGIRKLDDFTNGMQRGDLWIIAGETSQGKTALGITILKNAVYSYGARAAAYSLEMTHTQLTARILAAETKIPTKTILHGYLNDFELNLLESAKERHQQKTILYDEKAINSIDAICASIRRLHLKHKINLVMVDYLQIVAGNEKKSDESKIAEITRKLKNVARELEITILAISQLSRHPERPQPSLSRLRGSGQIEEAADLVLLLYRPEVYNRKYDEPFETYPTTGTAKISIAKGRNVGTGSFIVSFNPETTSFRNYIPEVGNPDQYLESSNNPF